MTTCPHNPGQPPSSCWWCMEDGNVPPPPSDPAPFPSRIWESLGTEQCAECDLKAITGQWMIAFDNGTSGHLSCYRVPYIPVEIIDSYLAEAATC